MYPTLHPCWGVPVPTSATCWIQSAQSPSVRAILAVNPSYYGIAPDLQALVNKAHGCGKLVLVDEAHGAHFGFHPSFPPSAMEAGADLAVQSTHKTLGAITQSAMLHVGRWAGPPLSRFLELLETTSPSPLLLVSLDAVQAQMRESGRDLLERALSLAAWAVERLEKAAGLPCLGASDLEDYGCGFDPTRLVVDVTGLGMSGIAAARLLREGFGIQVEMSDPSNVVMLVTLGDTKGSVGRMASAFERLALERIKKSEPVRPVIRPRLLPAERHRQVLSPREAVFSESCLVKLKSAAGRVSAELVAPYPPGIPLVCPGEEITRETLSILAELISEGMQVRGMEDPSLETVRVVAST